MPTKSVKSKKTTISMDKVNCGRKVNIETELQKLKTLQAQRKQLDAQIQGILKKADEPVKQDDICTRRRNVLFVDFDEYGNRLSKDENYYLTNEMSIIADTSFDSEHECESYFDEAETIDDALARMDSIIKIAKDFKEKLLEAQKHGCDRLIDSHYCKPEDFEFIDEVTKD